MIDWVGWTRSTQLVLRAFHNKGLLDLLQIDFRFVSTYLFYQSLFSLLESLPERSEILLCNAFIIPLPLLVAVL